MARIVREELWKPADLIIVTTNGYINKNGQLVMGRGAAKQAVEYYNYLPGIAASKIMKVGTMLGNNVYEYFFIARILKTSDNFNQIGLFQVKHRFDEHADLRLIRESSTSLEWYAKEFPDLDIRMNFPGIGFGGLTKKQVLPILSSLPNNVTICHY